MPSREHQAWLNEAQLRRTREETLPLLSGRNNPNLKQITQLGVGREPQGPKIAITALEKGLQSSEILFAIVKKASNTT